MSDRSSKPELIDAAPKIRKYIFIGSLLIRFLIFSILYWSALMTFLYYMNMDRMSEEWWFMFGLGEFIFFIPTYIGFDLFVTRKEFLIKRKLLTPVLGFIASAVLFYPLIFIATPVWILIAGPVYRLLKL
ncbi:MAG: hypothetical protein GY793_00180 [Proteobacteria bacterium]|nr:hypothetical protein [Pseudomonadota bacterium]